MKDYQLLWIDHSDGNPQSFYQGYQLIGELKYDDEILLQVVWSYYEQEEGIELYVNDVTLLDTKPLEVATMQEIDTFSEICENAMLTYALDDVVESCYKADFNALLKVMKEDLIQRKMLHPDSFPWSWRVY